MGCAEGMCRENPLSEALGLREENRNKELKGLNPQKDQ